MVATLREQGIHDERVLRAMGQVHRHKFLPASFHASAYENMALPIGQGQTISQPLVVAAMTEALDMPDRMTVLEIGTGSGYQTAVLSKLCRRIYTIERHKPLHEAALAMFATLKLHNVEARLGDGTLGWPEAAPFDRILVTAAAEHAVPAALLDQLALGGVLVTPIARSPVDQTLVKFVRHAGGVERIELGPVRFVPLVSDQAPAADAPRDVEQALRDRRRRAQIKSS
jgi:protein-L-isoaspartate(D-aspartate) O-methyltransferase